MNSEDDFRRHIIKVAGFIGHHVSHVESHETSAGIPDLNVYAYAEDLWIELKVIKKGQIKMRPTQRRWHLDRMERGGQSWVFVLDMGTGDILCLRGDVAATLATDEASWRGAAAYSNIAGIPALFYTLAQEQRDVRKRKRSPPDGSGNSAPTGGSGTHSENVGSPYRHGTEKSTRSAGAAFCSCIRCLVGNSRYAHSAGAGSDHDGRSEAHP